MELADILFMTLDRRRTYLWRLREMKLLESRTRRLLRMWRTELRVWMRVLQRCRPAMTILSRDILGRVVAAIKSALSLLRLARPPVETKSPGVLTLVNVRLNVLCRLGAIRLDPPKRRTTCPLEIEPPNLEPRTADLEPVELTTYSMTEVRPTPRKACLTLTSLIMLAARCTLVALTKWKATLCRPMALLTMLCAALRTLSMTVCLLLRRVPRRADPFMPALLTTVMGMLPPTVPFISKERMR